VPTIDPGKQPKLLGFAGHRRVPDAEGLRSAVRREILEMKELLGDRIIAVSSAAAGADLIFLRTCVDLRIPAIVILPFPEERFSEDFEHVDEWELARHLTGVALAKYVAPGGLGTPEAYHAVSRHLLEWADAFLFAWDGEPQRGVGGTGETVEEARDLGIPSRIIDANSMEPRWGVPPEGARKARHGFESRAELLDFLDARFPRAD
jgi:hypothetical protein